MGKKRAPPAVGEGMVTRSIVVRAADVVLLKGIVEAHDGLAQVFGEEGGALVLAAPASRERELDQLLADLRTELSASREEEKQEDQEDQEGK
jgi:hypothetical protein